MAENKNTNKWLLGCGIGCGVLLLLLIAAGGVGYFFVKDVVKGFQSADKSQTRMEERFGRIEDFTPDPDGILRPERVSVFLSVRDSIAWPRTELERSLEKLASNIGDIDRGEKSLWGIVGVVKKGFGFIPQIAEYTRMRNEALLDRGMGLGEYDYLYVLLYYSYLGKNPEDGPEFALVGENDGVHVDSGDDEEEEEEESAEDLLERRRITIVARIRRIIRPMMDRQLAAAEEGSGISLSWKRQLSQEVEAMRKDRERVPWQDGLPQALKMKLEPFRSRLESSYSAMVNPIELQPRNSP